MLSYNERRMLRLVAATLEEERQRVGSSKWALVEPDSMSSEERAALRDLVKTGYLERVRTGGMVLVAFTDQGYVAAKQVELS